jgi:hypothetical protein
VENLVIDRIWSIDMNLDEYMYRYEAKNDKQNQITCLNSSFNAPELNIVQN